MKQSDSDPLPYTQVDRAVKQTAALVASRLGVSFQHALGGLVQFWELNGDPRDLEALLDAGKEEVVLPRDEVARRFELAMGKEMAPEELASLRLLEIKPAGFRVRGMSRYFAPLIVRRINKKVASAGGRASVKARKERFGTAKPGSGAGSVTVREQFESSSEPVRTNAELPPNRHRTVAELLPNTAVSVQRAAVSSPKGPAPKAPVDPRHHPLKLAMIAAADGYAFTARDAGALKELLALGEPDEILVRWS